MISRLKRYLLRVILYFDILLQSLLWRDPGLTISSRCAIAILTQKPGFSQDILRGLGFLLNCVDKDHCWDAMKNDEDRAIKVIETLNPGLKGLIPKSYGGSP